MRRTLPIIAASFALAGPATALDMPPRKAGLWDMKMTMEGSGMPSHSSQHCIDAETDKMMGAMGGQMGKDMCSKQDIQRKGSTMTIDAVCKIGSTTTTSRTVITGSFDSAYTMKVTSKMDGAPAGSPATAGGQTNMTIEAKWLGACKADQKPGDMMMGPGLKMNIRDMQSQPGLAPPARR
jgi:hypothetical protein